MAPRPSWTDNATRCPISLRPSPSLAVPAPEPEHVDWLRGWRARLEAWLGVGGPLLLALVAHLLFCGLRVPFVPIGKRASDIAAVRRDGEVAWHFRLTDPQTRELAVWLSTAMPADAVLPWRGEGRGAMQLLSALLYPRLLVFEQALPPGATHYHGRPVFTTPPRSLPGDGAWCVEAGVETLRAVRR